MLGLCLRLILLKPFLKYVQRILILVRVIKVKAKVYRPNIKSQLLEFIESFRFFDLSEFFDELLTNSTLINLAWVVLKIVNPGLDQVGKSRKCRQAIGVFNLLPIINKVVGVSEDSCPCLKKIIFGDIFVKDVEISKRTIELGPT